MCRQFFLKYDFTCQTLQYYVNVRVHTFTISKYVCNVCITYTGTLQQLRLFLFSFYCIRTLFPHAMGRLWQINEKGKHLCSILKTGNSLVCKKTSLCFSSFSFFFSFTNNKLLYIKYNVLSSKMSIFECQRFLLSFACDANMNSVSILLSNFER